MKPVLNGTDFLPSTLWSYRKDCSGIFKRILFLFFCGVVSAWFFSYFPSLLNTNYLTHKINFYRNLNFGYRQDTKKADRAGQKLLFGVNRKLFTKCTKNAKGRLIERSLHVDLIYQNKVRIENNYEVYRRRQAIVEHP